MNRGGGKVDINGTEPVITLQAISLHDIVPFRVGRTKMPFKADIIHKRIVSAQPGAMHSQYACCALLSLHQGLASCILYHILPLITLQIGMMNAC